MDFGNYERIGLTSPNMIEQKILEKVRLYNKIMKTTQNNDNRSDFTHSKIKVHCIVFGHDAPVFTSSAIESFDISNYIKLHFVGTDINEQDKLIFNTLNISIVVGLAFVVC